ncbi:hypothetical protein A2382_00625 [Candidatus Woesebacteria bacterium RIFOXYB1_FULL_38_16]|uniref:Glycosyltransferase 2-like domain-containing protein n=1 Tax=Candidatus Woesebacteria bacterium RIFOXYB1_FULL_38_16 TaxID=1802538 RepID=A0A1F8CSH5_9BACT|nr:MAG: hypothetical protein A2382_00625 [Candidatus Woesebacteria bacterium RIFOXYB1_FULL_38_16]
MDISFIIPVKNEEGSISILYQEIIEHMAKSKKSFEIIFIDDGSKDDTYKTLKDIKNKDKHIKIIKHRGNWGKSVALQNGFDLSRGEIVITLDGDLQDDPKEIDRFIAKLNEGYDLVSGWKKKRNDPIHTVFMSRILNNFFIPNLTGVQIHDTNCGFKAYKQKVIKNLNLYGELYRYIPIIAAKNNYKVTEIEVNHRKRKFGKSKYGLSKNIKGLLDLITIFFLTGFGQRPGHFFGSLGLISFFSGFLIGLYITYLRITTGSIQYRHPLLFLGMLLMIIGIQLFSTGLMAEMIISTRKNRGNHNKIEEII